MNSETLILIVGAGLLAGGGLLLRRQVKRAPVVPNAPRRKSVNRASGLHVRNRTTVPLARARRPLTQRQCRLRLKREERRQRPEEARN